MITAGREDWSKRLAGHAVYHITFQWMLDLIPLVDLIAKQAPNLRSIICLNWCFTTPKQFDITWKKPTRLPPRVPRTLYLLASSKILFESSWVSTDIIRLKTEVWLQQCENRRSTYSDWFNGSICFANCFSSAFLHTGHPLLITLL